MIANIFVITQLFYIQNFHLFISLFIVYLKFATVLLYNTFSRHIYFE